MAFSLRPVDTAFYTLLTQSAEHLIDGSALLAQMLHPDIDLVELSERMRAAEHNADETTHEIARRVSSSFVTPFDREDIYALSSALDDVMDFMEEAVDLIVLYGVRSWPEEMAEQIEVLQRCAELTAAAMPRLQSMRHLDDYWIEINRLENAGDASHRKILARLFGGEYDALEVLKLKDVVGALEAAVDAFEKVANIVEQIHAKES